MESDLRKKRDQETKAQVHQLREESTHLAELYSFLSVVSAFYSLPVMLNVCLHVLVCGQYI